MARTTKPLLFTEIDKAKPKDKPYKLYDGNNSYVLVSPKGLKTWRWDYTHNGKRGTYTIGHFPSVSIADARQKVIFLRGLLAKGINPKEYDQQQQLISETKQTFQDFTVIWLSQRNVAPKTVKDNTAMLEKYAFPIIGHIALDELTKSNIKELAQSIDEKRTDGKPPRETTRRTIDLVSQILKDAIRRDLITENVTAGVKADYPKLKPNNFAHVDIFSLQGLLKDIDAYESVTTRECMKFLAHTFCRTQEMRFIKWVDIDFNNRIWQVNQETLKNKYKPHFVPLSNQVIDILQTMQIYTGGYEYVFYNKRTHKPVSEEIVNQALERMGYKGKQVGHGFRHLASTHLHGLGYNSDAIELQLHHELTGEIKQVYNHAEHHDLRREIMQAWSDFLDHVKEHGFDGYQNARQRLDNDPRAKLKQQGFTDKQIQMILDSLQA